MHNNKKFMKGLMGILKKNDDSSVLKESDLKENFPVLYKEYMMQSEDKSVDEFLKERGMFDSVSMILDGGNEIEDSKESDIG